jgi:hypothetical protein
MDMAAATEHRLGVLDKTQDVRGANLANVEANVHAKIGGWTMGEPDAARNFIGRQM